MLMLPLINAIMFVFLFVIWTNKDLANLFFKIAFLLLTIANTIHGLGIELSGDMRWI